MPSNKQKGSKAERELIKLFTENSWRAVRVAGSGVNDESPCDLIVGKMGKRGYTIEAKSSKKSSIEPQYFMISITISKIIRAISM